MIVACCAQLATRVPHTAGLGRDHAILELLAINLRHADLRLLPMFRQNGAIYKLGAPSRNSVVCLACGAHFGRISRSSHVSPLFGHRISSG